MRRTGVVWEPIYLEHIMSVRHVESPMRLDGIKEVIETGKAGQFTIKIPARPATFEELSSVHTSLYVDRIKATKGQTIQLDPDTSTCPKTYDVALMSAGGVLEAVKAVLEGTVDNAYAFVRPPGHHAEKDHAMGFCFFNNVAIAAEYALKKYGLKRVTIIDFDVHHGNGTQHIFYDRNDVFYISTHRWPFYPSTGAREEHGVGDGKGYTLNVPFDAGTGDSDFLGVYNDIVIPVIDEYKPELILVSAGYDGHTDDPLGGLNISTAAYNQMTKQLVKEAVKRCGGKIVFVLEGGYSVKALKECVNGALEILTDIEVV